MSQLLRYPGHELLLRGIVRASNCELFDDLGNRYVDLESGVWCTSIGHSHPRILRVLAEQASRISHNGYSYTTPVVEEAAGEILSLAGHGGGRCAFLCSGSEAVEYGVRVARMIAPQPLFLTMTDSYFGAYGSASQRPEEEWFSFDWMACAGPAGGRDPGEPCRPGCPHWDSIPFDRVGAFLFEPGSSSGLVRFPPVALIDAIVRRIAGSKGLVLVNEVTTGIGRTGTWFGFEHYGLAPDIVAMGKGLGNGYPVSAASFSPAVIERLGGREVRYAQSHQNDPLGAAVAREVVRVIREERLIERGGEIGAILHNGLTKMKERGRDSGKIRAIRGRGPMIAVELDDDPAGSFTLRTHRELLQAGYIVARRPGTNVLRIDPPLTIETPDVLGFLDKLAAVLAALSRGA